MKKTILSLIIITSLIACKQEQAKNTENLSEETVMVEDKNSENNFKKEALNQKLKSTDGNSITFGEALAQHKGKPILVDIWASWCPDCIKGMPKLHELQKQYDLVYMFLSYDKTEQDWKAGIQKYNTFGENFLIQSDWKTGEFRKAIDLDWIPRYILVDQNGEIAHYRAIKADDQELINTIKELIK